MTRPASSPVDDRSPGRVEPIESLANLLALTGVVEELEVRSTIGVCALHGGGLERATEVVAREVAERTGASYYAVVQPDGCRRHLPSTLFTAGTSDRLDAFLDRVDTVLSIHGYGRHDDFWAVLVGGADRATAHHVAGHLRGVLPDEYRVVDDVEAMPRSLRGMHPDNPVNRTGGGVQVELPPSIRWNRDHRDWSDRDGTPRAEHLQILIDGLVAALEDPERRVS
ncbi:MAG: poly-gamma-glutamate hydrolase family protein [Actinomycetota bacterium]|nr:poly-gamma-glutamate hydrolase family protein [Actinomycetota bacterium]MEE2958530.1 poly-gamma-glutamate hydrolase family protein [Actinomycetota bacterium]